MADQEVRSPHSLTNDQPHPRRGELTQARIYRGDSDPTLPKPRAGQNAPVQGQPLGVMQDRGRRV